MDEYDLAIATAGKKLEATSNALNHKWQLRLDESENRIKIADDTAAAKEIAWAARVEMAKPDWNERPAFVVPVTAVMVLLGVIVVALTLGATNRVYSEVTTL